MLFLNFQSGPAIPVLKNYFYENLLRCELFLQWRIRVSKGTVQSLETSINKWLSIQLLIDQVAAWKNNGYIQALYISH